MLETLKNHCSEIYLISYKNEKEKLADEYLVKSHKDKLNKDKIKEIEIYAQKKAIETTTVECMHKYSDIEPAQIWKAVYEAHVHRKSGVDDADIIRKIISADQSWKKSSGHAFEEMVKSLGTAALLEYDIEIVLQRDLSTLIKTNELANEPTDINWLKEQLRSSAFDLFTIVYKDNKRYCFGCVQSKTSVRDRTTRDREPSMQAMRSFFWSTIVVLDGDFLKLPKFVSMVDGGTAGYQHNGWHGLYVFSELYEGERIYPIDGSVKFLLVLIIRLDVILPFPFFGKKKNLTKLYISKTAACVKTKNRTSKSTLREDGSK
jgi:hypothetical protein